MPSTHYTIGGCDGSTTHSTIVVQIVVDGLDGHVVATTVAMFVINAAPIPWEVWYPHARLASRPFPSCSASVRARRSGYSSSRPKMAAA